MKRLKSIDESILTAEDFGKTDELIKDFKRIDDDHKKSMEQESKKIKNNEERIRLLNARIELKKEKRDEGIKQRFEDIEYNINKEEIVKEYEKQYQEEIKEFEEELKDLQVENKFLRSKKHKEETKEIVENKTKFFRTDSRIKTITMEIEAIKEEVRKQERKLKEHVREQERLLEDTEPEMQNFLEEKQHNNNLAWIEIYKKQDEIRENIKNIKAEFQENIDNLNKKIEEYSKFKQDLLSISLTPDEYKKMLASEEKQSKAAKQEETKTETTMPEEIKTEKIEQEVAKTEEIKPTPVMADEVKTEEELKIETTDSQVANLEENAIYSNSTQNERKIIKEIQVSINNEGYVVYAITYNNGEIDRTSVVMELNKKEYKKELKRISKEYIFNKKNLKKIDPYLMKILEKNKMYLANDYPDRIDRNFAKLDDGYDYAEERNYDVVYDMENIKNLNRADRALMRKIARGARKSGIEVQNFKDTPIREFFEKLKNKFVNAFAVREEVKSLGDGNTKVYSYSKHKGESTSSQFTKSSNNGYNHVRFSDFKDRIGVSPECKEEVANTAQESKEEKSQEAATHNSERE